MSLLGTHTWEMPGTLHTCLVQTLTACNQYRPRAYACLCVCVFVSVVDSQLVLKGRFHVVNVRTHALQGLQGLLRRFLHVVSHFCNCNSASNTQESITLSSICSDSLAPSHSIFATVAPGATQESLTRGILTRYVNGENGEMICNGCSCMQRRGASTQSEWHAGTCDAGVRTCDGRMCVCVCVCVGVRTCKEPERA